MSDLRWAPPSRTDDEAWAGLLAAIEAVDQHGETYELADLDDEWGSVWSNASTDAMFLWDGAELVAFGWLKTMRASRGEHRVECWGGVRPSHRGRGIGRALLSWQVDRASTIARALDPAFPTLIRLDGLETQHDLLALAARAGFEPARTFLEVARAVRGTPPVPRVAAPAGLDVRPWASTLDTAIRSAHRDAFDGHWGSEPRTEAEWQQWYTGHRAFRPDLSRVAVEPGTGEVAGFVLCAAYPQDWHLVPCEVWINSVGTRPEWRGRGVARALLTEVLHAAAAAADGFERAILGVDASNPTGALGLYRSMGFADVRVMRTLQRPPT